MNLELKLKQIRYIFTILLLLLIGCGDNNSSNIDISNSREENNTVTRNIVGYLIDAPVSNISYFCGEISDKTDINGKFECPKLPVVFKVGNIKVGSIDTIPSDNKVFPQDLAKVNRDDFTNPKVVKIASFLQSLDINRGLSTTIIIPDKFEASTPKDLDTINQNEIDQLLEDNNIKPLDIKEVERHLENTLLAENILVSITPRVTPIPTPTISPTPIVTPMATPTISPTPTPAIIFEKAVNNIGDITIYSYLSNNKNYTVTVYANQSPISDNSLSTIAIYGSINNFNTGANLKINDTYPEDTKFKIKVFDSSNNLLGESSILDYNNIAIDYGVISFTP